MTPEFSHKFAGLGADFYSKVEPSGLPDPFLVSYNPGAARLIGFPENPESVISYLSGNQKIIGGDYLASIYAGHQFGSYVPQLGDGRAIMIGELNGYEVQLKGAGKTPYSRFGDGRAVLRSCIREYLCSEAMHALGIPTTRALAVIGSSEDVQRETVEKAAVLTRLAESHVRFGHFEYFYYAGQKSQVKKLADFVISNFYAGANYEEFFAEVVKRTAWMIANWQAVGFAHGVMNTDNMSILGLTIDYGPFGFMENYDPGFICNHSDTTGRYAFDRQPSIGLWNLFALAQSLADLISAEKLEAILKNYQPEFSDAYLKLMAEKIQIERDYEDDNKLIPDILKFMQEYSLDYTNFFNSVSGEDNSYLASHNYGKDYQNRVQNLLTRRSQLLKRHSQPPKNPHYILRNYLAEEAIQKAHGSDYREVNKLLKMLQNPFKKQIGMEAYEESSPEWAKSLEISCSS